MCGGAEDLPFFLPGQRKENLPQVLADLTKQDLPPPLGNEPTVVFAVPFRMGSDKDLTFILLSDWFSLSHLEEDVTRRNGQTFRVSLVEPVAYLKDSYAVPTRSTI